MLGPNLSLESDQLADLGQVSYSRPASHGGVCKLAILTVSYNPLMTN